jgi:hypothetical protein
MERTSASGHRLTVCRRLCVESRKSFIVVGIIIISSSGNNSSSSITVVVIVMLAIN